jgi:hypothetical protein
MVDIHSPQVGLHSSLAMFFGGELSPVHPGSRLLLHDDTCPEALCSEGRYSFVSALSASCASPIASDELCFSLTRQSLQLGPSAAGQRTFPTLLLRVFPKMPGPLPRRSQRCSYPFLPARLRPSLSLAQVGTPHPPYSDFSTETLTRRQSFLNVQASWFACHSDRSHQCNFVAWRP